MKNHIRILSVAILTAIYCLAVGAVTKSFAPTDFNSNATSSQEKFISQFSTSLFCHTSSTEGSVNNFNNPPAPNFKEPFADFNALVKGTEQLFETEFTQYSRLSKSFSINLRKSDLIFPFHYFW